MRLFIRSQGSADKRQLGICLALSHAAESLLNLPLQVSLKLAFCPPADTLCSPAVCEHISSSAQGLPVQTENFSGHILSVVL